MESPVDPPDPHEDCACCPGGCRQDRPDALGLGGEAVAKLGRHGHRPGLGRGEGRRQIAQRLGQVIGPLPELERARQRGPSGVRGLEVGPADVEGKPGRGPCVGRHRAPPGSRRIEPSARNRMVAARADRQEVMIRDSALRVQHPGQPGSGDRPRREQPDQADDRGGRPRVDLDHLDDLVGSTRMKSTPTNPSRPGTDSTAGRTGAMASDRADRQLAAVVAYSPRRPDPDLLATDGDQVRPAARSSRKLALHAGPGRYGWIRSDRRSRGRQGGSSRVEHERIDGPAHRRPA